MPKIDLVMVSAYAATSDPTYLGVMREMKKEGRVRYIGVHHLAYPTSPAFGDLEAKRASGAPLPDWAAEFDARTWAQFFLKYIVSHPAVTVARTGTTNAAHMLENIGGGIGRLPDEATRKRMAALVESLPPRR